jgi:hypothetical protein
MRSRLLLVALALLVAACDTTEDTPDTAAVYVGNQGTFGSGTGSLTVYDPDAGTASASPLAVSGFVQNVEARGGRLYVFLNFNDSFSTGSGRIETVDLETDERTQEIDVQTPRDWAVVDGTAYVSNYYAGTVTPVFLATGQTGAPVPVGVNPEGVAAVGNRVHVALAGSDAVAVVSAENDVRVETIDLDCENPRAALADGDGEVWVVCNGRTVYNDDFTEIISQTDGEVVVLDGSSGDVVARFPLEAQAGTSALGQDAAVSRARDEVWVVVGQSVLRFDSDDNVLDATVEVGGEAGIGAVAYDDGADRLYLGRLDPDAPFSAAGFVTVHDRTGAEVARFEAGVIPASVAFVEE